MQWKQLVDLPAGARIAFATLTAKFLAAGLSVDVGAHHIAYAAVSMASYGAGCAAVFAAWEFHKRGSGKRVQ